MFYKYFAIQDEYKGMFLDKPEGLTGSIQYNAVGRFSKRNDFMPGKLGLKTFSLNKIERGFATGKFKLLKTKPKRRDMKAFIRYIFTREFN